VNVIGFSSGGVGHIGNVDRMVKAILDMSGHETEFVKLTDLVFSGCKGCVQLCASPQVCRLEDDAYPYYQKIKEADAIVIGAAVYSGSVNAIALSFIERFFGYRHVSLGLKDKPFILVVCGFNWIDAAVEQFERKIKSSGANILATVKYVSKTPPCLTCGRHQKCSIGGLYRVMGDSVHSLAITPDLFLKWEDEPDTVEAIKEASASLKLL
jgi:hypothetical protein